MRATVAEVFFPYTIEHEGMLAYPYADSRNLITVGPGVLVDDGTPNMMLAQPWRIRGAGWSNKNPVGGVRASADHVRATYNALKNHPYQGKHPAAGMAYEGLSNLTLDAAALKAIYDWKLGEATGYLDKTFPEWTSWPADAQLASLTMIWAMGDPLAVAKPFRAWASALRSQDFAKAAKESSYSTGYGLLDGRPGTSANERNYRLYMNAAETVQERGDYEALHIEPLVSNAAFALNAGGSGQSIDPALAGAGEGMLAVQDPRIGLDLSRDGAMPDFILVGGSDGVEVPTVNTPVSKEQFAAALAGVWPESTYMSIGVLWSQYAFETGRGKSCWNYNLGNIRKSDGDGRDWCVLKNVDEVINGKPVTFKTGRFRAYGDLTQGATDYFNALRKRYVGAWRFVEAGDPVGFVYKLKELGYFTGDEKVYAVGKDGNGGVRSLFNEWMHGTHGAVTPGTPPGQPGTTPGPKPSPQPAPPGALGPAAQSAFGLTTVLGLGAIAGVSWWAWNRSKAGGKKTG